MMRHTLSSILLLIVTVMVSRTLALLSSRCTTTGTMITPSRLLAKITPLGDGDMENYREAVMNTLNEARIDRSGTKLGGRELLDLIIRKWGVAYDLQLRKSTPFGEGSANIYVNVMWRYFGQKSFPMDEREYLEHLEAIGRYITKIDKVAEFKDVVSASRKRPNAYFGYAVPIPLNVDPSTAGTVLLPVHTFTSLTLFLFLSCR